MGKNKGEFGNGKQPWLHFVLKPLEQFFHSNPTTIFTFKGGLFSKANCHEPIIFIFQKPSTRGGCEPTCKFVRRGGEFMHFPAKFGPETPVRRAPHPTRCAPLMRCARVNLHCI